MHGAPSQVHPAMERIRECDLASVIVPIVRMSVSRDGDMRPSCSGVRGHDQIVLWWPLLLHGFGLSAAGQYPASASVDKKNVSRLGLVVRAPRRPFQFPSL